MYKVKEIRKQKRKEVIIMKKDLFKTRLTINDEVVNNMYKMRYNDIDVLNIEDIHLIINQLELIKDMLECAIGKEKKEIRLKYLKECKRYFANMINCDYTYNIRVMGRTDIDKVLNKKRIYKTDLEKLYYSVKVYKMTLVKYRHVELERIEKDLEKEVEKEVKKEKELEKQYQSFTNEDLKNILNENHNLSNVIIPILRKRGLTLYQYTEHNGYEWA